MKRFAYTLVGCAAGLIIGLGLASCVVMAHADESPEAFTVEIKHRKILNNTCFYFETRVAHEITALSCVKD